VPPPLQVANAAYARAVRNCPWVGGLWARALQALERGGGGDPEHQQLYERALQAGLQVRRGAAGCWLLAAGCWLLYGAWREGPSWPCAHVWGQDRHAHAPHRTRRLQTYEDYQEVLLARADCLRRRLAGSKEDAAAAAAFRAHMQQVGQAGVGEGGRAGREARLLAQAARGAA
jgi:hypothetical protein